MILEMNYEKISDKAELQQKFGLLRSLLKQTTD